MDALKCITKEYYSVVRSADESNKFNSYLRLFEGLVNEHFEEKVQTNAEHYKNELKNILRNYCTIPELAYKHIGQELDENIFKSRKKYWYYADMILDWMSDPYKGPVLDGVEIEYLKNVIYPFKKHVVSIRKCVCEEESFCYIDIYFKKDGSFWNIELPPFKKDLNMYKNMESWREYSIEELGL